MTTIQLKCRLPVLTTDEDMRSHCAAFKLTLLSWAHNAHFIDVTVQETVSPEQQATIAAAMGAQLLATIVSVREAGETFNLKPE